MRAVPGVQKWKASSICFRGLLWLIQNCDDWHHVRYMQAPPAKYSKKTLKVQRSCPPLPEALVHLQQHISLWTLHPCLQPSLTEASAARKSRSFSKVTKPNPLLRPGSRPWTIWTLPSRPNLLKQVLKPVSELAKFRLPTNNFKRSLSSTTIFDFVVMFFTSNDNCN